MLFKRGADAKAQSNAGETPLHNALIKIRHIKVSPERARVQKLLPYFSSMAQM